MSIRYPGAVLYENPIFTDRQWFTDRHEAVSGLALKCGDKVLWREAWAKCPAVVIAVSPLDSGALCVLLSLQTGHTVLAFSDELEVL